MRRARRRRIGSRATRCGSSPARGDGTDAGGSGIRPRTHLMEPRVTPEITHRWLKMYTMSSGAIAIRYDAKATV